MEIISLLNNPSDLDIFGVPSIDGDTLELSDLVELVYEGVMAIQSNQTLKTLYEIVDQVAGPLETNELIHYFTQTTSKLEQNASWGFLFD